MLAYRLADPERVRARTRAWREANPEKAKAGVAAYRGRAENREKARRVAAAWRKENPDRARANVRHWQLRNPERLATYRTARRYAINAGELSPGLYERLLKLQRGRCACCRCDISRAYEADHIAALSRGGRHEDANIQLLCRTCNRRKHAKDCAEFMQEQGYLI